jgi:hypothetical protein
MRSAKRAEPAHGVCALDSFNHAVLTILLGFIFVDRTVARYPEREDYKKDFSFGRNDNQVFS